MDLVERPPTFKEEQAILDGVREGLAVVRRSASAGAETIIAAAEAFVRKKVGGRKRPGKRDAKNTARWIGYLWGHQLRKHHGWEWVHVTLGAGGFAGLSIATPAREYFCCPVEHVLDVLLAVEDELLLLQRYREVAAQSLEPSSEASYQDILPPADGSIARQPARRRTPRRKRGQGGVPLSTRKPVGDLRRVDFAAHPVWEYALDEEDREGQDETWVKPVRRRSFVELGGWFLVATRFQTADGRDFDGYSDVTTMIGEERITPELLLVDDRRVDLARRDRMEDEGRRRFAEVLGGTVEAIFPIRFTLAVPIEPDDELRSGVVGEAPKMEKKDLAPP